MVIKIFKQCQKQKGKQKTLTLHIPVISWTWQPTCVPPHLPAISSDHMPAANESPGCNIWRLVAHANGPSQCSQQPPQATPYIHIADCQLTKTIDLAAVLIFETFGLFVALVILHLRLVHHGSSVKSEKFELNSLLVCLDHVQAMLPFWPTWQRHCHWWQPPISPKQGGVCSPKCAGKKFW